MHGSYGNFHSYIFYFIRMGHIYFLVPRYRLIRKGSKDDFTRKSGTCCWSAENNKFPIERQSNMQGEDLHIRLLLRMVVTIGRIMGLKYDISIYLYACRISIEFYAYI